MNSALYYFSSLKEAKVDKVNCFLEHPALVELDKKKIRKKNIGYFGFLMVMALL